MKPMTSLIIFLISIIKILRRHCKTYLFIGIFIIFIQLYSGYFLYKEVLLKEDATLTYKKRLLSRKNNFHNEISKNYSNTKVVFADDSSFSDSTHSEMNIFDEDHGVPVHLPCHIESTEAISAIQRAKTNECKRMIANISCEIKFGRFYPSRLINHCPTGGSARWKFLGCFIDNRDTRILAGPMLQLRKNSPAICSDICFQRGYIYSGVEYSKECFCGSNELSQTKLVSNSECNMLCSGDVDHKYNCGGFLRIGIYQTGLKKIKPNALKRPTSTDGPPVRIAYILTVNGRSLRQIHRLFKALYHKDHFIFIHVDARQNYLFRELLSLEIRFPNVRISHQRFSSIWGGASLLSVLLHSMEQLLVIPDWDFIINLSESDFPIKNNDALVQFLTANKERNFLKSHGHDTNKFLKKQGLDRTFLECENRMWRIGERKLPLGIRIDGGSDWICLNRQFVQYVIESQDELVTGLKRIFSYTLLPGESFFHTVLSNSELCYTFADNNLHITNWKRKLGCRCQYKHIVDWCGCSPNVFIPNNLEKLEISKSRNLFFARKFEPVVSVNVINSVEEWLYGPYDAATPNLRSHWDNRFHYLDYDLPADDAAYTLYHSAIRLSQRVLYPNITTTLIQAFTYHKNDNLMGIVVEFEISHHSSSAVLQTFMQYKEMQNIITGFNIHRLLNVEVNKNFDQKEQLFRNFESSLNPEDELVVATWWRRSDNSEILRPIILLIDPVEAVAAIVELVIEQEETVVDHKFSLKHPLQPGKWITYVILGSDLIATFNFTVLPLEFYKGIRLNPAKARLLHGGPSSAYSIIDQNFKFSLPINSHPFPGNPDFVKYAKEKASSHGYALQQWIDELVHSMYSLNSTCVVSAENKSSNFLNESYDDCLLTSWSSHSPDPKSYLGDVNPITGRFEDSTRIS